jgi:hypothetical protein
LEEEHEKKLEDLNRKKWIKAMQEIMCLTKAEQTSI